MKRSTIAAAVLLFAASAGAGAQNSPLVGLRAAALPERYRTLDGAVVVGPPRPIAWSVVDGAAGRWLALTVSVAAPDSAGGTELSGAPIVDAMNIGRVEGARVRFAACTVDGRPAPMVAALVQPAETGRLRVLRAWLPDLQAKRMIELPAATVACEPAPEA